jgi:hypothetical protein
MILLTQVTDGRLCSQDSERIGIAVPLGASAVCTLTHRWTHQAGSPLSRPRHINPAGGLRSRRGGVSCGPTAPGAPHPASHKPGGGNPRSALEHGPIHAGKSRRAWHRRSPRRLGDLHAGASLGPPSWPSSLPSETHRAGGRSALEARASAEPTRSAAGWTLATVVGQRIPVVVAGRHRA